MSLDLVVDGPDVGGEAAAVRGAVVALVALVVADLVMHGLDDGQVASDKEHFISQILYARIVQGVR